MNRSDPPACVAVDWGTSSLRLWVLAQDGAVLAERHSDEGLMVAREKGFAAVLDAHLAALGVGAQVPVTMCGMVGARSGWVEAAYLDAPVLLEDVASRATPVPHASRSVVILPGVAQRDLACPDVMRGEETKLLGLGRNAEGLVVMPGTHSKWARLEKGRLTGFATFMTGEVFAHLRKGAGSVLREALEGSGQVDAADPAFLAGAAEGASSPALLLNRIFSLRAAWLLAGEDRERLLARLSGLLIGLEIAGARARFGDVSGLILVAAGPAAELYAAALRAAGSGPLERRDADACVRAGLVRTTEQRARAASRMAS